MSSRSLVAAAGALAGVTVTGLLVLGDRDPAAVLGPVVAVLVALLVLRFAPTR